ncbi:ABC transporter ATP-binding protein [Jeotgalibacillus proteolyticus]|uniref:Bacitracin ABC transporter ATP-binding protein n=1 Tax=Jeotgalibacillus proteolyticus TaxID=2082395 RepID=A0A2S5GER2_9BACL|nr:ABC transporter ATP-binding protein [Jeotgalibacillus proteolyticus]PPA71510.1 bacitracin ABC transporter ATP-binding protein [Jeotgalibacillus proteolyticus]
MDKKSIVQLKNVSKTIRGKKIIDQVSFDVYGGEVFGFLGPNGAGKTTTIRMIVGLMELSEGDVIIEGKSIKSNYEEAVQHVGAIVENPEMYKFLTGYKNLIHYARMYKGISKEKIDEVVRLVGLEKRIHEKVKTYSLGMRQRLGIAQSLLHDPRVLILDEPTNGLDPAGIREIRDYIRRLAKERDMAVIVSSHLLSEMEMMCDRVGIIQNGKLIDVQMMNDFVSTKGQLFKLEVNQPNETREKVLSHNPSWTVEIIEQSLVIDMTKDQVPDLIRFCVAHNIDVYGVSPAAKTLEDRFLEVTSGEGVTR